MKKQSRSLASVNVALVLCALVGCIAPEPITCERDAISHWWLLRAEAEDGGFELRGAVNLEGPAMWTHLLATRRDGAVEPVEFRVDSLRLEKDSVFFKFAPLTISVAGRCVSDEHIDIRFNAQSRPGEQDFSGTGVMVRR